MRRKNETRTHTNLIKLTSTNMLTLILILLLSLPNLVLTSDSLKYFQEAHQQNLKMVDFFVSDKAIRFEGPPIGTIIPADLINEHPHLACPQEICKIMN